MSAPDIEMAYPLQWIAGRPRTPSRERQPARWRSYGEAIDLDVARARLRTQIGMMIDTWRDCRVAMPVLSTNIRFTRAGSRDLNFRNAPADVGVAFYFDLDGRPHSLACDRWYTVQDNIAAIAAHIEALRGQERWGVADLAQAFAGHAALPAPEQWWQVLGVKQNATRADIDAAWREKMRTAHPDQGGTNAAAARLNWARDEGRSSND